MARVRPVPDNYFDIALGFNKPIAISESGYASRDYRSSNTHFYQDEKDQKRFYEAVFRAAEKSNYIFITSFAAFDYNMLFDEMSPKNQDRYIARLYTGFRTADRKFKEACAVWKTYYKLPKK